MKILLYDHIIKNDLTFRQVAELTGPYRHHSCMSAYCVDAQEMADAVGMTCWGKDGKVRYFSQVLFHDTGK